MGKERVSAGEVCSIDTAKKYGKYSKYGETSFFNSNTYYTEDYSDVRTFTAIDKQEDRDSNAVCVESSDKKKAYPMCTIVHGIPYTQDPKDPGKCVINMNDFCKSSLRNRKNPNICMRSNIMPSLPISQQARCDERITDWYTIPNYHLGNKYNFVKEGKTNRCMKPCAYDKMPGYIEDPVDESSAGFMANTEVNKCYNKYEYMNGKYGGTGNFCPISWVYRLGQTREDIVDDLLKNIRATSSSNIYKDISMGTANQDADEIYRDTKKMLENVEYPSMPMMAACSQLHTPERVQKAYEICQNIHKNPASISTRLTSVPQQKVLKKACHVLFCNTADDLAVSISSTTKPLCFEGIDDINGNETLQNDRNIDNTSNTDAIIGPAPRYNKMSKWMPGLTNLRVFMVFAAILLILGVLSIFIILFWTTIKKLLLKLWCYTLFTIRIFVPESVYKKGTANYNLDTCITPPAAVKTGV